MSSLRACGSHGIFKKQRLVAGFLSAIVDSSYNTICSRQYLEKGTFPLKFPDTDRRTPQKAQEGKTRRARGMYTVENKRKFPVAFAHALLFNHNARSCGVPC
jgi:hypothetical protein